MSQVIQVIANFSDGRNQDVFNGLKNIAKNGENRKLIGAVAEADYNRSGFYLLGQPDEVLDTVFHMMTYATRHIDMNKQSGPHPWIGVGDVIAIIPVKNVTMEECVGYSKQLGACIGSDLNIPIYLFGEAATNNTRANLSNIIRGEFEGFSEKIKLTEWKPDFGPDKVHPTAGVTAIGARNDMISLNINLDTDDIEVAKAIAKSVRESGGGLKGLKAIALDLEGKDGLQVSTTIEDYKTLPLYTVLERVTSEAELHDVAILNTEVYGIVPAEVMIDTAKHFLGADSFNSEKQILESYLKQYKNKITILQDMTEGYSYLIQVQAFHN